MEEILDGTETEELEKTEFTFEELDDSAKERARNKYRETHSETMHDEWWDSVYEDAIECAKRIGIEIGDHSQTYWSPSRKEQVSYTKPDIWFALSYSQGDGCCFGGRLMFAQMKDAVARIKEHASQDETLHKLAADCEAFHAELCGLWMKHRLGDEDIDNLPDTPDGGYFTITGEERYWRTKVGDLDEWNEELEDFANQIVDAFASWIHDQLEKESDYLNSDEYIDERLSSGDYVFEEDGDFS